jgi:hypothetical protein
VRWVRPALLALLTLGLFGSTTWMVHDGRMDAQLYLATWSPILALMMGHLFGERSNATRKDDPR